MRIALLTEGGYPYVRGESTVWCDRLVRALASHEFDVYALSRSARQHEGSRHALPSNVRHVHSAPLWGPAGQDAAEAGPGRRGGYGRRERRRFAEHFAELAGAVCAGGPDEASPAEADRFVSGLRGLACLAREHGGTGLAAALCSEQALHLLEDACRAPGAVRGAAAAQVPDLLAVTERLERALRPLSLPWYGGPEPGRDPGLAAADVCHAVGSGPAALPGLLAQWFLGVPLLITEYGVRLREHYLASAAHAAAGAPVRVLLTSFQRHLARTAYRSAELITPGNTHARRWQERCGADRERLRTVYPGMDAAPFTRIEEDDGAELAHPLLLWIGRVEPAKDLVCLLHAFAEVRRSVPDARLLVLDDPRAPGAAADETEAAEYLAHCRALAAHLFPDEAADPLSVGCNPVSFDRVGGPEVPDSTAAYASAAAVVRSSVVEGFPVQLVEAMLSGRATVSTDAGAVCEVVGGTGLVVPPRNPRALADACTALLRDPARRARLGAAARARALELFTVEQNTAAFRGIYLELIARRPPQPAEQSAAPQPFALPPEAHLARLPGGGGEDRAAPAGPAASAPRWARRPAPAPRGPALEPVPAPAAIPGAGGRHR